MWPTLSGSATTAPPLGRSGPSLCTGPASGDLHIAERDTQQAETQGHRHIRQHLVSRQVRLLRRPAARPSWAGAPTRNGCHRKPGHMTTRRRHRQFTWAARRRHPGADLVPDRRARSTGPVRHPQRIDLDRLLHDDLRLGCGRLPANVPLRLPPGRRRHALLARAARQPEPPAACPTRSSTEADILDGIDELGVLLYGHARNAYWFGSRLASMETRKLAPYQNATGLQVTSAVLAGMVWALENADAGIVEADEIDFARCLQVQKPYLGPVERPLHHLDAADRTLAAISAGHRSRRSVAVQQRAGALVAPHPASAC